MGNVIALTGERTTSILGQVLKNENFVILICPECERKFKTSKRRRGGIGKGKYKIPEHNNLSTGKSCTGVNAEVE